MNNIKYKFTKIIPIKKVVELYTLLDWSSKDKPKELKKALRNSDTLITAWDGKKLVGLGNAISDKFLVVYYPHLAVHPDYQKKGIGREILNLMQKKYAHFHQQQIVADPNAVEFYKRCGFNISANCKAMWIYKGNDHD